MLEAQLRAMPAVVLTGARQTGKSTLVESLDSPARTYRSLDDPDVLDLVQRDPGALVGGRDPVTLDEVQRNPDLLLAVKRAIDRDRRAGRFLLTGSANLLLMKSVSESLAGRAAYLHLWPMTRREQHGLGRCGLWEELVASDDRQWIDVLQSGERHDGDWKALARRGGFPTPAVHMRSAADRSIWFEGYLRTYLERDLQMIASVSSLPDFRRLMRASALRLGQLVNQTEIARDLGMTQPTIHRYLNLLETSFMLVRLPAYAVNRTSRLIKTPRLYWSDVGLALHLGQQEEPSGAHFENLILHDLLVWRDAREGRQGGPAELFYWRTVTGREVDFVIELGDQLLPVEIKSSARPRLADAAHLLAFQEEYGKKARAGLLIHSGSTLEWLTPRILAAPWWMIL